MMGYIAMVGLLFVPLLMLLLCAWSFVNCRAEENAEKKARLKKRYTIFLIAAIAAAVIFGILKILFPIAG